MRVLFSTGLLGLAWFGAVNLAVSALAWVVSRRMLARRPPVSGVTLLALRLFPSVAASLFVLTVFLPAHVRFEPPQSDERFGVILAGLAAAGVCLLAHSARRLLKVWSAARRSRNWDAVAVASTVGDAFEVNGFSGVSLAGIVRTRILISWRSFNP